MNDCSFIREAFRDREMPIALLLPEQLAKHEFADLATFIGKPWSAVTADQLERHYEAIYWFSPDAFCYYLPGIFCAGINEDRPELIVNHAIVGMLDRSPDPTGWDDFFLARWPLLTPNECEATQQWILWLSSCGASFSDSSLSRAYETCELLKQRAKK
jgi:hypothetical protein